MNKAVHCRNEAISIDSNQWNLMHFGNNLIHLFISFEARGDSAIDKFVSEYDFN